VTLPAAALDFDHRPCPSLWRMAEGFGHVRTRTRRGGTFYYLDFGRLGRVHSLRGESFCTRDEAESVLRAIRGDVARGAPRRQAVEKWLPVSAAANRVDRRLAEWMEDFRAQVAAGERSGTTLRDLERWTTPGPHGYLAALGRRSIHSLDHRTLRAWQRELAERGVRGKSLWNVTAALSSFLGWLVRHGELAAKPAIPWPRYDEHVPQVVRPEVQDRILAEIPAPARGSFLAMALLGLRHSTAWVLDGRDYRDGFLWIRRARKGRRVGDPVRGPKNRRPHVVPVPAALEAWIEAHVPKRVLLEGGVLFPNPRTGRAWSPTAWRRAWDRACAAAGLPALKPYETLKHTTATEWMRRGASEREIQALLGHRDRKSTARYAQLADERLAEVVGARPRLVEEPLNDGAPDPSAGPGGDRRS